MPVLKLAKYFWSCFFLVVINSSVDHPRLADKLSQTDFLERFPQAYYFVDINPFDLPASTLEKLRFIDEPEVNLAWLFHLVREGEFHKTRFLWQALPTNIPETRLNELVDLLVLKQRWEELTTLSKRLKPTERLETVLDVQQGIAPDKLNKAQLDGLSIALLPEQVAFNTECKNNVLLLADRFSAYQQLNALRDKYLQKPEPEQNSFCLSEVYYVGNALICEEGFKGFAICNMMRDLPKSDFLIVMTKSGLANVRGTQMTLTMTSDYDVLVHELMHFSGFEDEYAIYGQKAHWLCNSKGLKAPNLFVGLAENAPQGWVKSVTCQNGKLDAFKPALKWSKMQFQELPLSEQYRQLWQKKVQQDWLIEQQKLANNAQTNIN
ncbi:hypothetical protein [Pseudoalteromonas phenolica]|uniref:hypothetical protein n=1 Tax=Pseudoalteromonas phenolica TaxID=161398 RepID=UPI001108AE68|nr:hypothetical protein [Pseudoalteromonas phenolica]